jgi:hypothetical protein
MPANPDFTNETTAAGTNCDGLDFVLTTTRPTPGKADRYGFVYRQTARRN